MRAALGLDLQRFRHGTLFRTSRASELSFLLRSFFADQLWHWSLRFLSRLWKISIWSCRDPVICYEMLRNFGSIISSKDEAIAQNSAIGTGPHAQEMFSGYGLTKRIEPILEKNLEGRDFWMLRNVTKFSRNSILPMSWRGRCRSDTRAETLKMIIKTIPADRSSMKHWPQNFAIRSTLISRGEPSIWSWEHAAKTGVTLCPQRET